MGSNTGTVWQEAQKNQIVSVFQRKAALTVPMDLFTLIPRTIIGVTYPAFASLKAVLSDSPESCGAWLRYWVVLGVFSLLELLLDLLINPLRYSFPIYLILKCSFLAWCMAPVEWNGSDIIFNKVLFPIFKEHHEQIEEQAEKAKVSIKDKLEIFFKKDKTDKAEKVVKKAEKAVKAAKEELKKE